MLSTVHVQAVTTVVAACLSVGCADVQESTLAPSSMPPVQALLAEGGDVLLDAGGLFKENVLVATSPSGEISAARARDLAAAFIKTHGASLEAAMEKDHGGPINIADLQTCGRVYYAETPYEQIAAEIPAMYHRRLGSWWLVTMCGKGGVRQVSLAVPAVANDLQILSDGRLRYPEYSGGNYVLPLGIPKHVGELPQEPERAVAALAQVAGRQVTGAPRLIAPPMRGAAIYQYPQMARWQVTFSVPATISAIDQAGSRTQRIATRAFQGLRFFKDPPLLQVAAPTQPSQAEFRWSELRPNAPAQTGHAQRKSDIPLVFENIVMGSR
jgi:hypothetical protein